MVFTETIFPPGKVLYKGLEGVPCQVLLHDTRFFYLTESAPTAKITETCARSGSKRRCVCLT